MWYPPKSGQELHLHLIMCFGSVSTDTQCQWGAQSEQQQFLSSHSSLDSTSMSQCLSHALPDLDFCHTMGWPWLWGCCRKLSIGQPSSQQISASLFALLLLLLPSSLQRKKCGRKDKTPGYRGSKARHQTLLTFCLRIKPTLHGCNEHNNYPEVAHGNDFPDPCLFFLFSTSLFDLFKPIISPFTPAHLWDRKVFLTIRSSEFLGYFWSFFVFVELCTFTCV